MPLKKHGSRKNINTNRDSNSKARIPNKENTLSRVRRLPESTTQVPKNRRVTSEVTSGKRNRSK